MTGTGSNKFKLKAFSVKRKEEKTLNASRFPLNAMKIAIDISPLSSGHKVSGTGFYLKHLKDALEKYFPENKYSFFTSDDKVPKSVDIIHYPYFEPFLITLPFKKPRKLVVTILDLTPLVFPEHFPSGVKGM